MHASPSGPPIAARSTPRRIVLRGVAPIVVGVVLGALLALLVTAALPERWTATSRVLVSATGVQTTPQTNVRTTDSINLDTEAQLVTSAAVVGGAVDNYRPLSALSFETTAADVTVRVPPNSSILEIAFTADSPGMARSASNALAAAYLDDRQANAQRLLDRQKRQAQQTVTGLTSQLETLSNQLARLPGSSGQRGLLQSRIAILKNQIDGENSQIVALGSVQITPGRVVTAASLPARPSSPSKAINVLSGAALGLVLGLLAAWLLLRYTRTVRRSDDLARVTDLPCLASLVGNPASVGEQYRRLAVIAASTVPDARRIVFATPLDSPSASRVGTGVAEALVRAGRPTALLRVHANDVNGPRPRGVAVESRPSTDAITPGETLAAGLDQTLGTRDILVIAVAGASTSVDAAALGSVSDAVVLVIDAGTRARDIRAAIRSLDEVGAPVLGVVVATRTRAAGDLESGPVDPGDTAAIGADELAQRPQGSRTAARGAGGTRSGTSTRGATLGSSAEDGSGTPGSGTTPASGQRRSGTRTS